jgi:hypothetical protein
MDAQTVTLARSLPNGDYLRATVRTALGYFSLTGELYERRPNARGITRYEQGREPDIGGQITDDVLRAFPKLAPFARMHLADVETGVPMHADANGWYFYSAEGAAAARRVLRVDSIPEKLSREAFSRFVDGRRERWAREAREARELLAELAGEQVAS